MKTYLLTAFSVSMIPKDSLTVIEFDGITEIEAASILLESGFESAVGHKATAKVLSEKFKFFVPSDRRQIKLNRDDTAIVASISVRLPEGKILGLEELREVPFSFYLARVVHQVDASNVASDVLNQLSSSKRERSS